MFDNGTDELVEDFLTFITTCHALMGQTGLYGQSVKNLGRVDFLLDSPNDVLTPEMISGNWDQLARTWAVLETPVNYGLTMSTILEFFKCNDRLARNQKETVLSLGAGSGLYELYLAMVFERTPGFERVRLVCLDAAPAMTAYTNELIEKLRKTTRYRFRNIRAVTASMIAIPFGEKTVSQLIVNNSLGWVLDWQRAVAEMARVIIPDRMGHTFFFVHPHPMTLRDQQGNALCEVNQMAATDLMDTLEQSGCTINSIRLMSAKGTGQAGHDTQRLFIRGKFSSEDPGSWRERAEKNKVNMSMRAL